MLGSNEKVESGVMRVSSRRIGGPKPLEVMLKLAGEVSGCLEGEEPLEVRHSDVPSHDAQRNKLTGGPERGTSA
jgi:hypothetical protein